MNIETFPNTSDEVLFGNVFANSHCDVPWAKSIPEHDGHAVIVGGGPSAKDWLDEIRWRKSIGQKVFALNGAARWLSENGIRPDHTVVVDARPQNIAFLGFSDHYYLASQCHPSLFDWKGEITLWHHQYPDAMHKFEAVLPKVQPDCALVGGGTTVGLSAMALAYILGYRKIHLYGYDSSFSDGEGHAYKQDEEPVFKVTCAGREFMATLSMAQQADLFPVLSDELIDKGCTITLRGDGLLPWQSRQSAVGPEPISEAAKYSRMWDRPEYRRHAPGENLSGLFCLIAQPHGLVVDFGCGTGRAALRIHHSRYVPVTMLDIAENCLDDEVRLALGPEFVFRQYDISMCGDLSMQIPEFAKHGYCTDVMEHIPPDRVDDVLRNIFSIAPKIFFQISTEPDNMGALIGHTLHLSVHPREWWKDKLSQFGKITWEAKEEAMFYVEKE